MVRVCKGRFVGLEHRACRVRVCTGTLRASVAGGHVGVQDAVCTWATLKPVTVARTLHMLAINCIYVYFIK